MESNIWKKVNGMGKELKRLGSSIEIYREAAATTLDQGLLAIKNVSEEGIAAAKRISDMHSQMFNLYTFIISILVIWLIVLNAEVSALEKRVAVLEKSTRQVEVKQP